MRATLNNNTQGGITMRREKFWILRADDPNETDPDDPDAKTTSTTDTGGGGTDDGGSTGGSGGGPDPVHT